MKKKALACLLAAVMALSLAACGSGSDNKKTSEKTESQDTNTSLEATNQLIEAEDPSALPETAAIEKRHTDRRCCRLCRCIQPGILGSK